MYQGFQTQSVDVCYSDIPIYTLGSHFIQTSYKINPNILQTFVDWLDQDWGDFGEVRMADKLGWTMTEVE